MSEAVGVRVRRQTAKPWKRLYGVDWIFYDFLLVPLLFGSGTFRLFGRTAQLLDVTGHEARRWT